MRNDEKDKNFTRTLMKMDRIYIVSKISKKACQLIFISRINIIPEILEKIRVRQLKCNLKMILLLKKPMKVKFKNPIFPKKTKWTFKSLPILFRKLKIRKCLFTNQIWRSLENVISKFRDKLNQVQKHPYRVSNSCPKRIWICIRHLNSWTATFFLQIFRKTSLRKSLAIRKKKW
jgi:hypothetical protein